MIRSGMIILFVVALGLFAGCSSTPDEVEGASSTTAGPTDTGPDEEGPNPIQSLLAAIMGDSPAERRQKLLDKLSSPDADLRREGVHMLGEKEPAQWNVTPKLLKVMARGDSDAQVRAAAVQVLVDVAPDDSHLAEVMPFVAKDSSALVRREGIAAMAAKPQPGHMDTLLAMLDAESDPDLRAKIVTALSDYNDRNVLLALLDALTDDYFSVSYRARESLKRITGVDYGYDQDAWREHVISKYLEGQGVGQ